jgi:hypothetical protein
VWSLVVVVQPRRTLVWIHKQDVCSSTGGSNVMLMIKLCSGGSCVILVKSGSGGRSDEQ